MAEGRGLYFDCVEVSEIGSEDEFDVVAVLPSYRAFAREANRIGNTVPRRRINNSIQ